MNQRPISKCRVKIHEMAQRGVGLRLSEIAILTGSRREVLEKIEKRALKKLRVGFAGLEVDHA